ncbi:hypothetical protein AMD24_00623 [Candidatus Xiphinematobacter sp. Idaho Grape]|nr:hypothetical protein AMD24_00623 [Candidatus Xiphinematobacter sp. Idaho Grape]
MGKVENGVTLFHMEAMGDTREIPRRQKMR